MWFRNLIPSSSFLKNWNVGWVFQIITFLGRSWDLQGLYARVACCFCDELEGGAVANKCVLVQTVSVLNSSQIRGPLLLVYRFRHDINQSLEKVKCWMDYLVLFPWKKLGVQFPSDYVIRWYCTGRGVTESMPQIFLPASVWRFMLAQSTEAFQLVSGFLTKGIGSCVVELLCLWEERGAFYVIILLMLPNLIF